ncbi:unnamed protein product [Prorocentrum cordatum]|uniref:Uncharacterized protein n=1 Tax=Prorocentrum cordatum TaxID=2364126 RepID=A0ABN9UNP8_9DINO|nr:unnamed protein product [Polarella glacialis]
MSLFVKPLLGDFAGRFEECYQITSALHRRADDLGVAVQQRPPDADVGRAVMGERAPDRPARNQKRFNDELIERVSGIAQRIKTIEQQQRSTVFHPPGEAHDGTKETLQALAVEIADLRRRPDLIFESAHVALVDWGGRTGGRLCWPSLRRSSCPVPSAPRATPTRAS